MRKRRLERLFWEAHLCGFEDAGSASEAGKNVERAQEERQKNTISGDDSWRVPPVPIPNTEVKTPNAESTWLETAREDRKLPDSIDRHS